MWLEQKTVLHLQYKPMQPTPVIFCMTYIRILLLLFAVTFLGSCKDDSDAIVQTCQEEDKESVFVMDFDVTCSSIPIAEIQQGGPPKDGIPAIDEPKYIKKESVDYLSDDDLVIGIVIGSRSRAYPTRILDRHEIVNDSIGDNSLLITYCPLCGSGMAFSAEWGGERRTFGVSGLLYNNDVLLYDRKTESLWSQIKSEAVTGVELGSKLVQEPIVMVPWKKWREDHPNTEVLSTETGHGYDYSVNAYDVYRKNNSIWFPVSAKSNAFQNKDWVLGIEVNGRYRAYAFSELMKSQGGTITDFFNGQKLSIEFDQASQTGIISDENGKLLPYTRLYWFAWYTFHPNTEIYRN
jgi:hypothetical protein